jgi:NADPH:quinone reductase-like Zn-dependent oxidoreductase
VATVRARCPRAHPPRLNPTTNLTHHPELGLSTTDVNCWIRRLAGRLLQAIVQSRYSNPETLHLSQVPTPVPGDNEVLIRVHAAAASVADVHLLTGKPYLLRFMGYGLLRPKSPIIELSVAGKVEAVGPKVSEWQVGDEVFGELTGGAFAEYVCAPSSKLARKPAKLSFEDVAAIPDSSIAARQGLRDVGGIRSGQHVLINGASGGVGTYAVQIAKALGARVTAVCSQRNAARSRFLGVDVVIDYNTQDFTKIGCPYDLMLDLVGNRNLAECGSLLQRGSVYVGSAGQVAGDWFGPLRWMASVMVTLLRSSQKMAVMMATPSQQDLCTVAKMLEAGR